MKALGLIVLAWATAMSVSAAAASPALATCPQNADRGIWVQSGQATTAHGVQVDEKIEQNNNGDCAGGAVCCANTAYMAPGGNSTFNWAEIGYEQFGSPAQYTLFTEWGIAGKVLSCGGVSCIYSSGCIQVNQIITLRVVLNSSANDTWNMDYSCNGGGFTVRDTSGNLQANNGHANGEISNHSTNNDTYHSHKTNLEFKSQSDTWTSSWGSITCSTALTSSVVVANGNNAQSHGSVTSYDTGQYSSGIC